MARNKVLALLSALAALSAGPAAAHEYWIAPSTYAAGKGLVLNVSAWVGTGFRGDRKLYAASRTRSLSLHAARDLDLTKVASDGDSLFARFTAPDDSGLVVSFLSGFTTIELPATDFERYLALEGLDAARLERARRGETAAPGRERYRRSVKTWVAGPATRHDHARVQDPLGLPLEIVPDTDPVESDTVTLRVLSDGDPVAGILVRAWRASAGDGRTPERIDTRDSSAVVAEARTDARGKATLVLPGDGEWLLSAVRMLPCPERAVADWESTWASLTFGRRRTP